VENQVLSDVAYVESHYHRDVAIDLVGYSRGAVIAATVAKDIFATHTINGTPQSLSVHWMGLFDPVGKFAWGVKPKSDLTWATIVPPNVQNCDCAIKDKNLLRLLPTDPGYQIYKDDQAVADDFGGTTATTKKFSMNHIQLGHSTIVLGWMIKEAKKVGVPVT